MQDSPKDLRKKILGREGEILTCKYLKKRGYRILERNFVTPFGEADIIAFKDGVTCFVEVKTRTGDGYGNPAEAVGTAKQSRYRRIAGYYCMMMKREIPIRFDVSAVVGKELEYYENAYI